MIFYIFSKYSDDDNENEEVEEEESIYEYNHSKYDIILMNLKSKKEKMIFRYDNLKQALKWINISDYNKCCLFWIK